MRRLGLLDLLRAVAAVLVLLSHVAFWTGAGSIDVSGGLLARGDSGVAVFFALSAFLLLRPWIRAEEPTTLSYAVHRLARILPAYWIALAAVLISTALLRPPGGLGGWRTVLAHVLLLQGFTGASYQSFSQTWSLTNEVVFYAVVPLLGPLIGRAARHHARHTAWALMAIAAAGMLVRPTHLAWFAVGALVAVWRERGLLPGRPERPGTWLLLTAVIYLVASSPLAGPVGLTAATTRQAVTKEALYAVLAGLALAVATTPLQRGSGPLAALADHRLTRWSGDVSYGVFLWHVLVLQLLYRGTGLGLFTGLFWPVLCVVTTVSVGLAAASRRWVERPAMNWARCRTAAMGPPVHAPAD